MNSGPETRGHATAVVDRLWRAYAPFQRGRNTAGDLTNMIGILTIARFIESEGKPESELVRRWVRAVEEARRGASPLTDLRAVMRAVGQDAHIPGLDLSASTGGLLAAEPSSEDVPWLATFLTALQDFSDLSAAVLREVCDLLLERYVQENPHSAGEFYTPREVVRLVVDLISPEPGDRILDPACGTGGFLAAAAQRIAAAGPVDGGSFEAHAIDHGNTQLARMNMALHGVQRPAVMPADPSTLFRNQSTRLADRVLSNPPFNQRIEGARFMRWPFGEPPDSSANFAWLQLAWTRLSNSGTAAIIMPPAATWTSGREADIRAQMVARGAVLAIIALPPNLFRETAIPVHIWVLARDKSQLLPAEEHDRVLFIDAGALGTQAPRQLRSLTETDTDLISHQFRDWLRAPHQTADKPGFSRSVSHEEILANGGNLDPRTYVVTKSAALSKTQDLDDILDELGQCDTATTRTFNELRHASETCARAIRDQVDSPHKTLREILSADEKAVLLAGPSGSLIRAEDYVDTRGVPVVMPKDLTDTGFDDTTVRCISADQAERLQRFRLLPGDVVLARRGELGRCAVVRAAQRGWICGTGCFVLRPPRTLDADYFAAFLRSPSSREWLANHSTGSTAMKTISLPVLGNLPIVVPGLELQHTIAAMMARLDESELLLQKQLELTQTVRREALLGLLRN